LVMNSTNLLTSVVTNNGTMQASNGGILQLGSGHWSGGPIWITQGNGGVIQALDGSTVMLGYDSTDYCNSTCSSITGGTLTTAGSGQIDVRDGFTLDNVTNAGNLYVRNDTGVTTPQVGLVIADTINNT